ncbi:TPA: 50S ribosomal protein L37ae [Candidatus Woesearchaeota archaeon]|nr:50S ribosomal protein L37ae [Candidatus Woesearchaeota archaeon]
MTSTKRFGSRYGRKPKTKFAKIEAQQRAKHKCNACSKIAVRRLAMGIWQCTKCDIKFAGRAYIPGV